MHGCSRGVCVVAPGGGHVWLLPGGVHGCSGGHAWLLWGECVVAPGGCAWLLQGRGACVVALEGGRVWDTTRYGDTVNERAVRILLECILV